MAKETMRRSINSTMAIETAEDIEQPIDAAMTGRSEELGEVDIVEDVIGVADGQTELQENADTEAGDGTSSISTSIFNLANNVAGVGILTLAGGKASGTGWVPSIITCAILAFVSAHTFNLIAKSCELTGERNFKGLWTKAFGKNTAPIVDCVVFVLYSFGSIIYISFVGDILSALLAQTGNPPAVTSRTSIIIIGATCIL
jgi:hypothetical protein